MLVCVFLVVLAHETAGAPCTRYPRAPFALEGCGNSFMPRATRAARSRTHVSHRHCERSEAIHSFFLLRNGLLRCARNDDQLGCLKIESVGNSNAARVPRMLRSAPHLRRGALLIRGPSRRRGAWVPALRCTARGAAPRPGHGTAAASSPTRPPSTPR